MSRDVLLCYLCALEPKDGYAIYHGMPVCRACVRAHDLPMPVQE